MCDASDDRDPTWSAETESVRELRDLVGRPHVVEALDGLSNGPTTVAQLTRRAGVGRRGLTTALRVVAARGLVEASNAGSWDGPAPLDTLYCLNDRGRAVVATLSRLSVWTMLVEGADLGGRPDFRRDKPRRHAD